MIPKAIDVKILNKYKLLITFDNKEKKIFDVEPYLKYKAFKNVKNENIFRTVKIGGLSIEWADGTDICPDELYNNGVLVEDSNV